jgi:hypothetical protein
MGRTAGGGKMTAEHAWVGGLIRSSLVTAALTVGSTSAAAVEAYLPQPLALIQTAQAVSASADPVAIVESVDGGLAVAAYDALPAGTRVQLGGDGRVVLIYFASCIRDEVLGGELVVGTTRSRSIGGRIRRSVTECQATPIRVSASTAEGGGAAQRATPFDPSYWHEVTTSSMNPEFLWGRGAARFRVVDLDSEKPQVIWEAKKAASSAVYPPEATALVPGRPYRVEAISGGKVVGATVFTVDPNFLPNGSPVQSVRIDG